MFRNVLQVKIVKTVKHQLKQEEVIRFITKSNTKIENPILVVNFESINLLKDKRKL